MCRLVPLAQERHRLVEVHSGVRACATQPQTPWLW